MYIRYLLFFILLFSTISSYSQKKERVKLKGVEMQNDYHNKISWVLSKKVALNSRDFIYFGSPIQSYLRLYYGIKEVDGKPYITSLKLGNSFFSDEWVFFDEISYLIGTRKEIKEWKGVNFKVTASGEKDSGVRISEVSTVNVYGEAEKFIKYILENEAKPMSIRYDDLDSNKNAQIDVPKKVVGKLKKHFKALIDSYNKMNEVYKLDNSF
ncbi:hypothetical protein [Tenacibaculum sp. C7A-26P2]|uniref:hypothetical protein n=1 Tax=Tenacibaculum sp. C7A-26P2 TaxID=3447504 RepID=UPI003F85A935